jgi:hypothetical protein
LFPEALKTHAQAWVFSGRDYFVLHRGITHELCSLFYFPAEPDLLKLPHIETIQLQMRCGNLQQP